MRAAIRNYGDLVPSTHITISLAGRLEERRLGFDLPIVIPERKKGI
jgi:hypothetical protein